MAFYNNLLRANVTLAHDPPNPTAGPVLLTTVFAKVQYMELERYICLFPDGNLNVVGKSLCSMPTPVPFYVIKNCKTQGFSGDQVPNILKWFGISDPEMARVLSKRVRDLTATRYQPRAWLNMVLVKFNDIVFDKMADLAGEHCAICSEAAGVAAEMPCGHRFHFGCVASCLKRSYSCPVCGFVFPRVTRLEADYWRFVDTIEEPELFNVLDEISSLKI
ncbi:hypothetical protein LINGRAHAP2_LOCUS34133 [Linum grandiflorum]